MVVMLVLWLHLHFLARFRVFKCWLDVDHLVQLEMLVLFTIIHLILQRRLTITIKTIFVLLVLTILDICIVVGVGTQNFLRSKLYPFLRLLLSSFLIFFRFYCNLFLYHKIEIDVTFNCHFNKVVFPVVLKQI